MNKCPTCNHLNTEDATICTNCDSTLRNYFLQPDYILENRYRIVKWISAGGFYIAYLAIDEKLNRKITIRQSANSRIIRVTQPNLDIQKLFENEARILVSLSHPNLIKAYDYFYYKDSCCVVVDYIEGSNLGDIVDSRDGFLPENQVLIWGKQLCDVLEYLHGKNPPIIHRNIKPESIILEKGTFDRIKLTNFSSARFYIPTDKNDEERIGTDGYSPPEQYKGHTDMRSDVYSLGATLHYLITRRDPRMEFPFSWVERPVQKINPKVSQLTANIIRIATELDPRDRYQSIGEMRKAIEIALNPYHDLQIFLCHSSSDKPKVRKLYQQLLKDGFNPWLDEENLLPGLDWQLEIQRAVRESAIVLVCLSKEAINKAGYVQKEIKYALDVADEQPEGKIFIIPLKLEECEVPLRLKQWQWVNFFVDNGYQLLLRSLKVRAAENKRSRIS